MFSYISQGEAKSFKILPAGVYEGQITSMDETTSKKGDPMLVVNIKVFSTFGSTDVRYYLVGTETMIWKIDAFIKAVKGRIYNEGQQVVINPAEFINQPCYVRLSVEEQASYKDPSKTYKSNVVDEVLPEAEARAVMKAAAEAQAARERLPQRPDGLDRNNSFTLPRKAESGASGAGMDELADDDIPF